MPSRDPVTFVIGYEDFDLDLLPEDAREVGSEAFRSAVTDYYENEFGELGGTVNVAFGADGIGVTWHPPSSDTDLFERALRHLNRGDLPGAVPVLQALVAVEPTNAAAHHNLGMALSDLGRLDEAQLHLLRAVHLDADNVDALVALGVALYRAGDAQAARRRLEQAVERDSANGYAHRNLAAVLANLGEREQALAHFRDAYRLLPDDQQSAFGLARALDDFGGDDDLAEADALYQATIAIDDQSQIAEMARQARSRIAQRTMRDASPGPRMDAVMYCLGALERFATMRPDEVQGVGFEIALLGQRGLEVNNPDVTYTLRTLPGDYTGMHLMSLMYVAFQQVAPELDIGFDLAQEYTAARQLFESRTKE